jgi:uncharacterized membrane protein YqjE
MLGSSLTKFLKLDQLVSHLTGYVETKVALIKVEVKEDIDKGISQAVVYLLIAFVFALVILFFSLGVAVAISTKIGPLGGYGIMAVLYLIVGLVLYKKKDQLIKKVKRELSKSK